MARNHAASVSITRVGRAVTGAARDSIRSPGELGRSSPRLSVKVCSWPERTTLSFYLARDTEDSTVKQCWLGDLIVLLFFVLAKTIVSKPINQVPYYLSFLEFLFYISKYLPSAINLS